MLIEDLKYKYPLVYQAAVRNSRHGDVHIMNFIWDETSEGQSFWSAINGNRFEEAFRICPHLDHRLSYKTSYEWSSGTYCVAITNGYFGRFEEFQDKPIRKGSIFKIKREAETSHEYGFLIFEGASFYAKQNLFKWFDNKLEAERFSKLITTNFAVGGTSIEMETSSYEKLTPESNTKEKEEPRKLTLISKTRNKTLNQVTNTNNIKIK